LELAWRRCSPIFCCGTIIFNQPVVVAPVRIPDNVIKHDEPLELQLELPLNIHARWFTFKAAKPKVCVFEAIDKQLERAHLKKTRSINIDNGQLKNKLDNLNEKLSIYKVTFGLRPIL
jgi:hypothetical protein